MGRILAKDWLPASNPRYLAGCDPPDLAKGEIGRRRTLLCSDEVKVMLKAARPCETGGVL
jgi:hypothetical protein